MDCQQGHSQSQCADRRPTLRRAALPMPTGIMVLEAIRLAGALLFRERTGDSLTFTARDLHQAAGARAPGFRIIGF